MEPGLVLAVAVLILGMVVAFALDLLARFRRASRDHQAANARFAEDFRRESDLHIRRLEEIHRLLKETIAQAERLRAQLSAAPPPAVSEPAAPAPDPLHARVWKLKDEGRDPAFIARETGLDAGEVELILGLRGLSRPS